MGLWIALTVVGLTPTGPAGGIHVKMDHRNSLPSINVKYDYNLFFDPPAVHSEQLRINQCQ